MTPLRPSSLTWSTTQGADLSWVQIGFQRSLRLGYERTHYGTGYYIYQLFANGTPTSTAPSTWTSADSPPADVLALLARAGEDLLVPEAAALDARAGQVDVPVTFGDVPFVPGAWIVADEDGVVVVPDRPAPAA